jgi:hypothetical protein
MKQLFDVRLRVVSIACAACFAVSASAQELWKYTDKNGKVTYSDQAPIDGEKAVKVTPDITGTVVPGGSAKNAVEGKVKGAAAVDARASEREAMREDFRKKLDAARQELEDAKKALDAGRDPTEEERQIVVGRGKDGKPTGANTSMRKPEYYERIAGLEAAVKKAEEKVAASEKDFREKAPQ